MVHGPIAIETPTSCRTPHVGFELDNGVKVIIIKDPTTQKSIAAMSINAGTHHDPPEVQGLAHFCEHMLFMGTEAYPAQGEYSRFIEQNGGHSNAWTEDASTQYYFQCANGAFEEALKMFSHFFVSPLFNPDCVEREMQAVHSEDEKNHTSDYWRVAEIRKLHLSNKVHPDSRYGNGNIHTLKTLPEEKGINVRDKLLAFYEQHYVAENAAITVYSPLEPQAVLDVIAPILGKMRNGKPTVASFGVPPLNVSADEAEIAAGTAIRRGTWVQVKGSRAEQRLTLNFPVPYSHKDFEEKPTGYASHVIGHECNGSILAVLKKEGLADALNAGAGNGVDHDHDRFSVGVSLTVEGVRQVDRVIQIIFDGIELLRRAGIVDAIYDEMIATHELAYNLTEIDNPSYHAAYCGRHANRYKSIARCITGYARATRRDDAKNMDVINRLTPNNCYFMLQLQDIDSAIDAGVAGSPGLALPVERLAVLRTRTDQTSFVHGAKFGVGIVPQEQLDAWNVTGRTLHPDLSLPAPNPYVARRFDVAPLSDQVYPTTRVLPRGKLHSKRDNRFGLPKAFFAVSILSAEAYKTPKARFFTRVAVSMLKHALTETLYFAELGAINTEIIPDLEGLGVSFGGASDKLMELARFVLGKAINTSTYTEADETVYVTNAQKNIRDLLGNYVGQPYTLATEASQVWTSVTRWDFKEVLEAAIGPHTYDNATSKPFPSFDEFKAFIGVLFGRIRYEALWLGNVTHDGAEEAATLLEELFSTKGVCAESDLPDVKSVLQIPTRADEISTPKSAVDAAAPPFGFIRHARAPNPKDPNHAVHVQIQAGPRTPRTRVLCDCTMALISSLFFEALRTNETIGYIVGCSSRPVMDTMSLVFVAQSATYDAHYVLGRIVAFLDAMPAHFAKDVTEEAFKSVIEAQKASRRDEHLSLMDEGAKHWARRDNPWGFGFRDLELAELETVTLPEIRAFAETHLSPDSPDARVLVVAYFADDESRAKFMTVEDRTGFVNLMPLRVVLKPKLTPPTGSEEIKLNAFNDPAAPRCITLYELEDRDSWRASRPTFPRSKPSE